MEAGLSRPAVIIAGLGLTLAVLTIVSLGTGQITAEPHEIIITLGRGVGLPLAPALPPQSEAVILAIRLPRVLLGIAAGAALALSGAALQALFGNPLADPGLIGVSSGAAAAATAWIAITGAGAMTGGIVGLYSLPIVAFLGALAASALLYILSRGLGRFDTGTLLLIGVAINAACGVLIGAFTFLADDMALRSLVFWTMGSLSSALWPVIALAAALISIGLVLLRMQASGLNVMALGEGDARALGIDTQRLTLFVLLGASLATGAATAVSGVIGFVGLVVPHLLRLAGLADARVLLPASALAGAILVAGSDVVARLMIVPAELPIGLVTGAFGTPLFVWMILSRTRRLAA
jgi:iron complex transport system permease protein